MSQESKTALRTRRAFLKALGTAASVLPFYKMLEDQVVLASTGALPLKFLGVGAFHCTSQQYYARRSGETDTNFDISYADCALRPFDDAATYGTSFKNKIIVFEGFDYGVGELGPTGAPQHVPMHGALGMLLTGSSASSGTDMNWTFQNASLDQVLAAQYGGTTKFRSVEICTELDLAGLASAWCIAYGPGGTPLSRLTSPFDIWNKCFASLIVPDYASVAAAAARQNAIQKSVLDFAMADIQRLNARLAGAEKQKLDQHLTAMRDLETRLTNLPPPPPPACVVPPKHPPTGNAKATDDYVISNAYNGGAPYFNLIADLQIELLTQLFICDLTRFATIVFAGTAGSGLTPMQVPVLDGSGTELAATGTDRLIASDFHNSIAHKSSSTTLAVQQAVATVSRYYYGKIARLMQNLQAANLLDSTLILIGNEGGDGAEHSTRNVPIILAGGANGTIAMGRRVVAPGRTPQIGAAPTGVYSTSHNPILVAVANAFGANITSFGTCSDPKLTAGVTGLV